MKKMIISMIMFLFLFGCSSQERHTIDKQGNMNPRCQSFNDRAMDIVLKKKNVSDAIQYIDSAILCNPENYIFKRNKGMILFNSRKYKATINYFENNTQYFSDVEYLTTLTECYFNLKDTVMFDFFKIKSLSKVENNFEREKNESNLIIYATIFKKFDGNDQIEKILNENKFIFSEPEMCEAMLKFLDKIPTLKW